MLFFLTKLNTLLKNQKKCVLFWYQSILMFYYWRARAMVQWLRQTAHDQEVVGRNPDTVYWMVVSNASYYINSYTKIMKIKVAEWGTPKKIFKKMFYYCLLNAFLLLLFCLNQTYIQVSKSRNLTFFLFLQCIINFLRKHHISWKEKGREIKREREKKKEKFSTHSWYER